MSGLVRLLVALSAWVSAAVQVLLVGWFSWPSLRAAPHDLPVVVSGPPTASAALTERLQAERPGAFQVTTVADQAAADQALRDRDAYAAFVLDPQGVSPLRSAAYFDGAATTTPLWVLAAWSLAGLVLLAAGRPSLSHAATSPARAGA